MTELMVVLFLLMFFSRMVSMDLVLRGFGPTNLRIGLCCLASRK